jgi:hypothetical protein
MFNKSLSAIRTGKRPAHDEKINPLYADNFMQDFAYFSFVNVFCSFVARRTYSCFSSPVGFDEYFFLGHLNIPDKTPSDFKGDCRRIQ